MDSKAVNQAIRAEVRPLLLSSGFSKSTARTFWRYHRDRVDVVNFQSFNCYNADVLDITTYSYALNLGCFLRYIPNQYPNARGAERLEGDMPKPKEYECQIRGRLRRSYTDRVCSDKQIWYIDSRGSNLDKAVHDTRMVLKRDGLPWFDQFSSSRAVYEILGATEEDMGTLWGFGRPGSPIRMYFLGYAARSAGLYEAARVNLTHAASTKSFEAIRERILSDARRAV